MRKILMLSIAAFAVTAPALSALAKDKPVTEQDPGAIDVATTPLSDLNLKKGEIPQLLVDAQAKPYDLSGLQNCATLVAELEKFDALLGDDFDLPQDASGGASAGRIGQTVVGTFVPFRGLVREVSGANKQQRALDEAIRAGYARRGFLKGIGQTRKCQYPARPATANDIAKIQAERAMTEAAAKNKKEK